MVGVGPAATDVDADGAMVPLQQLVVAAVVYTRIVAHLSLVFCRP